LTLLTPQRVADPTVLGLYATFHDEGETADPAASHLGPFDELVIRSAHVVGERAEVGTVIAAHGANGRWRAADLEMQRGLEAGRGDATRSHIRAYTETRDLYIRAFDEPERSAAVAELGPFSIVDVGTHDLRGDGLILAVRVSTMSPWLLTDNAGADLQGIAKKVLVLRARSTGRVPTAHSPAIVEPTGSGQASPVAVDVAAPFVWVDRVAPVREIYISRPDVPRRR
jgi:hypothetical protein